MTQEILIHVGAQLARVYSLAVAYPDDVPGYVRQNTAAMEAEVSDDSFGRFFVERLRARALSGPAPDDVYGEAIRIATDAGAPEFGQQLGKDFMRDRTDMLLLAGYLDDLLKIMPALLKGNPNSYHRTTLYQTITFVWRNAADLVLPGLLKKLQQMTFELNEWYVGSLMNTVRLDYLRISWPRRAKHMEEFVRKIETAKKDGDAVTLTVYASAIWGTILQYASLFGLSEEDIGRISTGPNVEPLVEWLRENDWLP